MMTFYANKSWRRLLNAALVSGLLTAGAFGLSACDKKPEEQLLTAKMAVLNSKPDIAEKNLEPVLQADPTNFEGLRLMAAVDSLRGEFATSEEKLLALKKTKGFDGEGADELSVQEKAQKDMLERDLVKLYREWADSIDPSEDMATFESVLKKGLAISVKQPRLNTMLVEAYENHAKKLVEQGKKTEAAEYYEKIPPLLTSPQTRSRAKERASNLRFAAGRAEMLEYFNSTAKARLVAEKRYLPEEKLFVFQVEQGVAEIEKFYAEKQDKKVKLDIRDEKHQAAILQFARGEKLVPALIAVVVEATGVPEDSDFTKFSLPKDFKIAEAVPGRRSLKVSATIPLDAVLKLGSDVREKARLDAADAERKAAEGKADDKPEGEGAEEGTPEDAKAEAEKEAPAP